MVQKLVRPIKNGVLVLGAPKGNHAAFNTALTIPNNKGRRISLCIPDDADNGGAGGRRVSIGGRRNSTGNR